MTAARPPLLQANDIRKRYGVLQALDGVDLQLGAGEIHGLCGHNGAGKSTLVKVITGLVNPDSGEIKINGEPVSLRGPIEAQACGIALVDQELSLAPDLSVEENIFLGSLDASRGGPSAPAGDHPPAADRARSQRDRAKQLLAQVGLEHVDPHTMTHRLALGERQLVEIARALGRNARIVLLDEPTATLSEAEIERVFDVARRLVAEGKSLIYISHRLGEILELCDRVTVMRDGRIVATRSCAAIDNRSDLIRMMIGIELPKPEQTDAADVTQEGRTEIRRLRVPPIVEEFGIPLRRGEIVGITGQVGAGPTEVLRAIAGLHPEASGEVIVDGRRLPLGSPTLALKRGIAFVSNDRKAEGVFLQQPVRANLLATRLHAISPLGLMRHRIAARIATRLAEFVRFDADRLDAHVETLSGGNQQKIFLGRCLDRSDVKLLLLDEPTRGVDVGGRAEIHELLREAALAGVTVMFASTEVDEILELSHRVVTMFGGRIVATRPRAEVTAELLSADMTMSRERDKLVTATAKGSGG